jgi:hypothetical protein
MKTLSVQDIKIYFFWTKHFITHRPQPNRWLPKLQSHEVHLPKWYKRHPSDLSALFIIKNILKFHMKIVEKGPNRAKDPQTDITYA